MQLSSQALLLEPRKDYDKCMVATKDGRAVYSRRKVIKVLMKRDGMDADDATEFFEYNIEGAYMGEWTPIFVA